MPKGSMMRVVLPLPAIDFDVTEVAVPWKVLSDAGHELVFATEDGQPGAADPLLLTGVIFGQLGADPEPAQFYDLMIASPEFLTPLKWADLVPEDFDGLILPGGHAPGMRQYLGAGVIHQFAARFWALERPVGAICHGPIVLARAKGADGRSVLYGKKTAALPGYMERLAYYLTAWKLGRYYRTYPDYVQAEIESALKDPSDFRRGPITFTRGTADDHRHAFVVQDGHYVSARWPGDAYLFAERFVELLGART